MNNLVSAVACRLIAEAHLLDSEVRSWCLTSKAMQAKLKSYRMKRAFSLTQAIQTFQQKGTSENTTSVNGQNKNQSNRIGALTIRLETGDRDLLPQLQAFGANNLIRTVVTSDTYNEPLDRITWPAGLAELNLGRSYHQFLPSAAGNSEVGYVPSGLPNSLIHLRFHQWSRSSLMVIEDRSTGIVRSLSHLMIVPPLLQTLLLPHNGTVNGFILPEQCALTTLVLPNLNAEITNSLIERMEAFTSLKTKLITSLNPLLQACPSITHLTLTSNFSSPLNTVPWPHDLRTLIIGSFKQPLKDLNPLPANLTHLNIQNEIDAAVDRLDLMSCPSLKYLRFGRFNSSVESCRFPFLLETLVLGEAVESPSEEASWIHMNLPLSIKRLVIESDVKQSLFGFNPPPSLVQFSLRSFSLELSKLILPQHLEEFVVPHFPPVRGVKIQFSELVLPSSLKRIHFSYSNSVLDGLVWPNNLQAIDFGDNFDQPVSHILRLLPPSVTSLTFGLAFNQPLSYGSTPTSTTPIFPPNLKSLTFGPNFSSPLALPIGLESLQLGVLFTSHYSAFPESLQRLSIYSLKDGVELPPRLKYLRLGGTAPLTNSPFKSLTLPNELVTLSIPSRHYPDFDSTRVHLPDSIRCVEISAMNTNLEDWRKVKLPIGCYLKLLH